MNEVSRREQAKLEREQDMLVARIEEVIDLYVGTSLHQLSEQDRPGFVGFETHLDELFGDISEKMTDHDIDWEITLICADLEEKIGRLEDLVDVALVVRKELFKRRMAGCRTTTGYDESVKSNF